MKGSKNAGSEYKTLSKMGFISLEEVDEEETQQILASCNKTPSSARPTKRARKEKTLPQAPLSSTEANIDLPAWREFDIPPALLAGLARNGYSKPTPIQEQMLNSLREGEKDILGSAPTGSGKTLAFLLPILTRIISHTPDGDPELFAVIIVPTRELALQIKDHLERVAPPTVRAVTLVGGLSQEKQERLLQYHPQVLIGTPGRLGEVLQANAGLQKQLGRLRYLVLDEADRLCETGHFKDLDIVLEMVNSQPKLDIVRRTFLFSATLAVQNMGQLRRKIKFTDKKPTVISVGVEKVANPETLSHYRVSCLAEDKLAWLCAILRIPSRGRTLIFVNTIELVRGLARTLQLLGLPSGALHAQMQQRQRIKSLERFRASPTSILVTSDVAARGLDIPSVQLVIHFHIPRDCDTFIHRSGRTARANHLGISVAMVSPHEVSPFNRICAQSKISIKDYESITMQMVEGWKKAVKLAERISKAEDQQNRQARNQSWEEKAAETLGIDLETDRIRSKLDINDEDHSAIAKKNNQIHLNTLKEQLLSHLSLVE